MLQAVYPSSGYGYDTYFDHVGTLTTESERNQLVLYALQDRMQAVIRNFDGVKDAVVILTPGEQHVYVLDSGNQVDATASVTVTMEDGKTLTDNQVKAIRKLVGNGLAGLNVENVEILDTYGNPYSEGDDLTDLQDASALKLKLEEQCNNSIRTRVMQALLPLYGEGNVQVSVNTVVDVDRTYTDSTDYNPCGLYDHLQRRRRQRQHGFRDRQDRGKLHPARLRLHRSHRSGVQGLGDRRHGVQSGRFLHRERGY